MATFFKVPSLASKRKPRLQFPEFEWADVSIKEEVGNGTFGSVYIVKYKKEDRNVVVKKNERRVDRNKTPLCVALTPRKI